MENNRPWDEIDGSIEIEEEESEAAFRFRVANILENEPYNHEVYFHDPGFGPQFHMHKAKGYVDLYIKTSPEWAYHEKFPVIGIETKVSRDLGWMVDAILQIRKYKNELRTAEYEIDGLLVPAPTIFLVCTTDSFYYGHVYRWVRPQDEARKLNGVEVAWEQITELYDRLLFKQGAALLRKRRFMSNMYGPPKWYDLAATKKEIQEGKQTWEKVLKEA